MASLEERVPGIPLKLRSLNIFKRSDSSVMGSYKGDLLTTVNVEVQIHRRVPLAHLLNSRMH